ncbi:hypothetical protein E2C01_047796 [Portunus trituberculatus]|uniref:Uncharacterized protein n=1 Tax=Portunus trituberculatus TaxID=210409 RepID=A0A5B7G9G5_PORTR|nr:hypothetical protein [Portunus trituberculatus]
MGGGGGGGGGGRQAGKRIGRQAVERHPRHLSARLGQTPSPSHKGAGVLFTRGSALPCLSRGTVSRRERRDSAVLKAETPRLST